MLTPEQVQQYRDKYGIKAPPVTGVDPSDRVQDMRQRVAALGGKTAEEPTEPEEPGFISNLAERLNTRGEQAAGAILRYAGDKQTLGETAFQVVGSGLGFGADVIGEGISRGFKAVTTPEQRQDLGKIAQDIFLANPEAQKEDVRKALEWWQRFSYENPRAAANLGAAGNVVDFLLNATGVGVAAKGAEGGLKGLRTTVGKVAGEAAEALESSAARTVLREAEETARELVMPLETLATRKSQVPRVAVEGAQKIVQPTAREAAAIQEVASLPGVKKGNLLQENYNIIRDANRAEAIKIAEEIKLNDFAYDKATVKRSILEVAASLEANPYLTANKAAVAKMIEKANSLIDTTESTGSALFQARKDFDTWMEAQRGGKLFDRVTDDGLTVANREIRNAMTDALVEAAERSNIPAPILSSLRKQTALYTAMDNLAPKAAREADTMLGRTLQKLQGAMPGNKLVRSLLAAGGLAGVGVAATAAPVATATLAGAYFAYRAGKLVLKPQVRDALAGVLRAIESAAMGPDFVSERAVIMDILRNADDLENVAPETRKLLMPPSQPGTPSNPLITPPPKGPTIIEPQAPTTGVPKATINKAYNLIQTEGGVTISAAGDVPKAGFVFAPSKATEFKIPKSEFTTEKLDEYAKTWYNKIKEEGGHLGGWVDGDTVYLDVSRVVENEAEAMDLARQSNQLAIYDIKSGQSKYLAGEAAQNPSISGGQELGGVPSGGTGGGQAGRTAESVAADLRGTIEQKLAQLSPEEKRGFLSMETDSPVVKAVIEYMKDPKVGLSIKDVSKDKLTLDGILGRKVGEVLTTKQAEKYIDDIYDGVIPLNKITPDDIMRLPKEYRGGAMMAILDGKHYDALVKEYGKKIANNSNIGWGVDEVDMIYETKVYDTDEIFQSSIDPDTLEVVHSSGKRDPLLAAMHVAEVKAMPKGAPKRR